MSRSSRTEIEGAVENLHMHGSQMCTGGRARGAPRRQTARGRTGSGERPAPTQLLLRLPPVSTSGAAAGQLVDSLRAAEGPGPAAVLCVSLRVPSLLLLILRRRQRLQQKLKAVSVVRERILVVILWALGPAAGPVAVLKLGSQLHNG